jgi:hypothetical protein
MTRFLYGDLLWTTIKSRAKKAKRIKAAVAYVTKSALLALNEDDALVVDATNGAVASGRTSAATLLLISQKGCASTATPGFTPKLLLRTQF